MTHCESLLAEARATPKNVRFPDLCALAECFGWRFARSRGSHFVYKRPGAIALMTFQSRKGMAKAYQVRQLVSAIDELLSMEEPA